MRRLLPLTLIALLSGCPDDEPAPAADAGVQDVKPLPPTGTEAKPPTLPPPLANPPADPIAALGASLPGKSGWCVQVRSVQTKLEADQVTAAIEKTTKLPTTAIEADLGDRGVWWRICVGREPTEAAAQTSGEKWTADGAPLLKHMDAVKPGQARFLVMKLPKRVERAPTRPLAELLLRAGPDEHRQVALAKAADDRLFGAVTLPADEVGVSDLLAGDADGKPLAIAAVLPEGCAVCRAALDNVRPSRRVLGAGDAGPWPGEELLVEEVGQEGKSVLSVLSLEDGALVRRAWFLLGTTADNLKVTGDAQAVQADDEPGGELAIRRIELPIVDDRLCALRERTEILKLDETGATQKLDAAFAATMGVAEASGGAKPTRELISAYDETGDFDAGSEVCARYLEKGRDSSIAKLCIARVGELLRRGRVVSAVNAAGLLAHASELFRAAVAAPLYDAVSALDEDGRLVIGTADCEAAPLVTGAGDKRLPHLVRLARVRLAERIDLADVVDEVFVTGARDFGPDTPVGEITAGWLGRLRARLPARAAAIDVKLVPTAGAPEATPDAPAPPPPAALPPARPSRDRPGEVSTGTPGESGYIHIKVHDDDEGQP